MKGRGKRIIYMILLLSLAVVAIIASLCIGEISFSPLHLPDILRNNGSMEQQILLNLRLPRTLMAFAVGGSLSLCGVILQGIYRNPLVEPYTLGISGGASLGVTIAIVCGFSGLSTMVLPLFGFAGAFVTIFIVYMLSITRGRSEINRMLLVGIMISFISSSMVMFLVSITTAQKVHSIIFWTMGSLSESSNRVALSLVALALLTLAITYLFATPLNALRLGEDKARHLGIETTSTIRWLFIITSLLTGSCIALAGVIGFVGLIVPQAARYLFGEDYKNLLAGSFITGSIFLVICDIIARTIIYPNELPVGVITGIVGGVAFIIILSRSKKRRRG